MRNNGMVTVFCAGPYSGPNIIMSLGNMRRGLKMAIDAMKTKRFAVFAPWTDFIFGLIDAIDMQTYKENSIGLLEASDAVLLAPGWEHSEGTLKEIEIAQFNSIPVFENLEDLIKWDDDRRATLHCPLRTGGNCL